MSLDFSLENNDTSSPRRPAGVSLNEVRTRITPQLTEVRGKQWNVEMTHGWREFFFCQGGKIRIPQKTESSAQIQSYSDDSEAAYLLRPLPSLEITGTLLSLTVSAAFEAFALNKSNKNPNN